METSFKYAINQLEQARKEFREVFDIGLNEFIDNFISAMVGNLILDIPLLHKYLLKENKGYEKKSFNALILEKYGNKGILIIEKLTL